MNTYIEMIRIGICWLYAMTSPLLASPITANVIGASISEEGISGIEYRSGYEWDDDNAAQDRLFTDRIDIFHNVTDDSQFRMFFNRFNPQSGDADFTNAFIEPAFQLFHADKHGFDGALLTGLTLSDGDNGAHQMRTVLAAMYPFANNEWFILHNSIIAHQFGAEAVSGLRYEARWRLMNRITENTQLGVEMFNNFGNLRTARGFDRMTHRAGIVMTGNMTDSLGYQTGVMTGLSEDAPDMAAKFWLVYQFD